MIMRRIYKSICRKIKRFSTYLLKKWDRYWHRRLYFVTVYNLPVGGVLTGKYHSIARLLRLEYPVLAILRSKQTGRAPGKILGYYWIMLLKPPEDQPPQLIYYKTTLSEFLNIAPWTECTF